MKVTIDIQIEEDIENDLDNRTRTEMKGTLIDIETSSIRSIHDIMRDLSHLCLELLNYEARKKENEEFEKKDTK